MVVLEVCSDQAHLVEVLSLGSSEKMPSVEVISKVMELQVLAVSLEMAFPVVMSLSILASEVESLQVQSHSLGFLAFSLMVALSHHPTPPVMLGLLASFRASRLEIAESRKHWMESQGMGLVFFSAAVF